MNSRKNLANDEIMKNFIKMKILEKLADVCYRQWRSKLDNWGGGNILIFVFCLINYRVCYATGYRYISFI